MTTATATTTEYRDSTGRKYNQVANNKVANAVTGKVYPLQSSKWRRFIVVNGKGVILTEIV